MPDLVFVLGAKTARPGDISGFCCRECGTSICLSPEGAQRVKNGALPVCNPCGFKLAKTRQAFGGQVGYGVTGAGAAQIGRMQAEGKLPYVHTEVDVSRRTKTEVFDFTKMHHPTRPKELECDYCCRKSDRLWMRQTRGFGVEAWPKIRLVNEAGSWGACVFCNPLVESRDMLSLVARASIVQKEKDPHGFERLFTAVFSVFEDAPPHLWEAGKPWPVKWR